MRKDALIIEPVVSFKDALKLAKLGFNELCINVYSNEGILQPFDDDFDWINDTYSDLEKYIYSTNKELNEIARANNYFKTSYVTAPTLYIVAEFIRDRFNYTITVLPIREPDGTYYTPYVYNEFGNLIFKSQDSNNI